MQALNFLLNTRHLLGNGRILFWELAAVGVYHLQRGFFILLEELLDHAQ
jgi:hypothetical protein